MRSTANRKLTLETLVPRDVLGALRALGIDAEERGDEAVALCPHPEHNDRSPSWSCNLEDGRHHCFACGFGGSFTYLVTKMLGMPTPDAMQWVRERKIKDVAEGFVGPRVKKVRQAPGLSEADMWRFTEPPEHALASRNLTAEACRACDVRWDDERQLWITPVRDPYTGRLWGWQEKNAKYFRNRPLDLPKSHALFGFQSLGRGGTAVLVESPLDVPYLRAAGIDGAVSGYGVSVSVEQINLLRDRVAQVVLALDNDRAGWKGVGRLAYAFGTMDVRVFNYGAMHTSGTTCSVLEESLDGTDPGNLDADELSWGVEHAVPAWRLRIPWLS